MSFNPEIVKGDSLYNLIVKLVIEKKPTTILEIGSANGLGSTQAFIEGVKSSGHECKMVCMEANIDRWRELAINCRFHNFISCIHGCSSSASSYMSEHDIEKFMKEHGYRFNIKRHSVDTVKKWRSDEIDMIEKLDLDSDHPLTNQGAYCDAVLVAIGKSDITKNYEEYSNFVFDMVLIDGSAFTGDNDLDLCYGAKTIIMDDTMDIKCYHPMQRLLADDKYKLISSEPNYRNGYAAFEKVEV